MTNSTRAELFRVLEELSEYHPHWRIGQLVANMAGIADVNIWDVEDEQLLASARDYLERRPSTDGANDTLAVKKERTDLSSESTFN